MTLAKNGTLGTHGDAKKGEGISVHQLHRVLEVTYRAARFLVRRTREAMRGGELAPFGSDGGIVEADETFTGSDRTIKPKREKKVADSTISTR